LADRAGARAENSPQGALQSTMRQQESHRAFDVVAYLPNTPDGATLIGKLEMRPSRY
jgi:hypothetical protein